MHERDTEELIDMTAVESPDGPAALYRAPDAECTVSEATASCRVSMLDWARLDENGTTATSSFSGGFAPEAIGEYVDFLASNGRPDFAERFDCQLGHNLNVCEFSYAR